MHLAPPSSKLIVTSVFLLGLAACGGGGGGSSSGTAASSQTSPVPSVWTGVKQTGFLDKLTYGRGVAVDANGSVFVTGRSEGNLDGNSTSGSRDWVLLKYTSLGATQYVKQMHATLGAGGAESNGVAVVTDASANVYVSGYTYGDLDGNTKTGTIDLSFTKFDSSGAKQFTTLYGVSGAGAVVTAAAIDTANGFVYVVGETNGSMGTATLTGISDAFVAQFSTSGTLNYVRQLGATNVQTSASSVAVDSSGNVYVVGHMRDDTGNILQMGPYRAFLARYSSNGTLSYMEQLGATGVDTEALSVALDGAGTAHVVGYTKGGLHGNTQTGTTDAFIAHYSTATGAIVSVEQVGATSCGTWATGVATDSAGNLYVAGETDCSLNGNTLAGTTDTFVAKYLNASTLSFLKQLGATGKATWPKSIAVDTSGNIFVAGSTTASLPGSQLNGLVDMFVAKYNNSGVLQ